MPTDRRINWRVFGRRSWFGLFLTHLQGKSKILKFYLTIIVNIKTHKNDLHTINTATKKLIILLQSAPWNILNIATFI